MRAFSFFLEWPRRSCEVNLNIQCMLYHNAGRYLIRTLMLSVAYSFWMDPIGIKYASIQVFFILSFCQNFNNFR